MQKLLTSLRQAGTTGHRRRAEEDFAAMKLNGSDFMFHADHTYRDHALSGIVAGVEARGAGVELRVYGCDPDHAEAIMRHHVQYNNDKYLAALSRMTRRTAARPRK